MLASIIVLIEFPNNTNSIRYIKYSKLRKDIDVEGSPRTQSYNTTVCSVLSTSWSARFMSFTNFFFIYLWRLDIIYYWHLGMKFYNWFLPEKNKSKWLYIIHLGRFARCCLWVRNTIKNPSVYMDFVLSLAWIEIVKTWLLQLNSDMVNVEYPLLMFVIHTPPLSNTKR